MLEALTPAGTLNMVFEANDYVPAHDVHLYCVRETCSNANGSFECTH